jgi:hypothetical protein
MDSETVGEGWGEGGGGNCVTLTGSCLRGASGFCSEGIGKLSSSPCNPREVNSIGRIRIRTGAGKFFEKLG